MTASTQVLTPGVYSDILKARAVIDGHARALSLSCFFAMRKAQDWQIRADSIAFAFAPGESGYVVEHGNASNFTRPQTTRSIEVRGCSRIDVRAQFEGADFAGGVAALFCLFCDADGQIVAKERIACTSAGGQGLLPVPAQAQDMCLALRLSGGGILTAPVIRVRREKIPKAVQPVNEVHIRAQALMNARRYRAALAFLEGAEPDDATRILLLKCAGALHHFEKAVQIYESLGPKGRANAAARIHYLRGLANLNETAKAQRLIEACALNLKSPKGDIDFLSAAYPFAAFLSDGLAQLVRGRILASAAHLKKTHLNHALRCAHDLLSDRRFEEFYRLCDALNALNLPAADQARLHILSAQGFYVLGRHDLKLEALNRAFGAFDLAPVALANPDRPFGHDNIICPGIAPRSVRGPKISVLMTTFNSADTIDYALRSVMNQSYADLEIIVADDCSADDTRARVAALAAEDSRIRLIALPRNSGTYVAKNTALQAANGVYVTCHDSDDWAHPQKIARTADALNENPALIAAATQHVRYDPARGFRGRNGYIQLDAPSLMYRRASVIEKIGFYDSVRAGADTEHQYRIERAFGRGAIKFLPDMLTLFLWSDRSLTGGGVFAIDDDAGIFSRPRSAYRQAYMHWHEDTDTHYIPFPLAERPFPIPPEMMP